MSLSMSSSESSLLEKPGMVLGPDLTFCAILRALASPRSLPTALP